MVDHPLKKFCKHFDITTTMLSQATGISKNYLYQVLKGTETISDKIWAYLEGNYDDDAVKSLKTNVELWELSPHLSEGFVPEEFLWVKNWLDDDFGSVIKVAIQDTSWKLQELLKEMRKENKVVKQYIVECICGRQYTMTEFELDELGERQCEECGKVHWLFKGIIPKE